MSAEVISLRRGVNYQYQKGRFSRPENTTRLRDWGNGHGSDILRNSVPLLDTGEFIRQWRESFSFLPTGERRLNLELPGVVAAERHVHKRLWEMVVPADERNQELLTHPLFVDLGITTTQGVREAILRYKIPFFDEAGREYLPYDFVQVNDNEKVFGLKRFNWDTEANIDALLYALPPSEWSEEQKREDRKKRLEIAKGELLISAYIMDRPGYGFVENATARGLDDRTQPPRHTTMIRRIWDAMSPEERHENREFFEGIWEFAKREYWEVWNALDSDKPPKYSGKDILNQNVVDEDGEIHVRYGHRDVTIYNDTANLAAGHDKTRDVHRRERDHTRIQLEMYLWQAERDFAWEAEQSDRSGKEKEVEFWKARQDKRAARIIKNHKGKDWLYHYDFKHKEKSSVEALTGFLAYSIVDDEDMRRAMLEKLKRDFLGQYGLMLTTLDSLPKAPSDGSIALIAPDPGMQRTIKEQYKPEQWDGPNQFFNITSQIVDTLVENREYATAAFIMEHTLVGLIQYYKKYGKFPEKINVLTGEMGNGAEYGDQDELMMPAGVFAKFMKLLPEIYEKIKLTTGAIPSQVVFNHSEVKSQVH